MSKMILRIGITAVAVLAVLASIGYAQTITTFDVPGSTITSPLSINPAGEVTGVYYEYSFYLSHGFLRKKDGNITTFDVPGSTLTIPRSINPAGQITGTYLTSAGANHGFLRRTDGTIVTFDPPGSTATLTAYINPAGQVMGDYEDASSLSRGFLRGTDGTIVRFDAPGSNFTFPVSLNPAGQITGWYYADLVSHLSHAFLRNTDGTFTTFDVPGSVTVPNSINPAGRITGYCVDAAGTHGFLRNTDGTFITFDVPGSNATYPVSLNPAGQITGAYGFYYTHGFLRRTGRHYRHVRRTWVNLYGTLIHKPGRRGHGELHRCEQRDPRLSAEPALNGARNRSLMGAGPPYQFPRQLRLSHPCALQGWEDFDCRPVFCWFLATWTNWVLDFSLTGDCSFARTARVESHPCA